jgi:death-on-curing protein
VSVEYLDLIDYLAIAAAVTGLDVDTIIKVTDLNLADSALHAPAAGFGDTDFYPDFADKAAVLVVRLARNHPLPDGNKRAAWVSLRAFIDINGWRWEPVPAPTDRVSRLVEPGQDRFGGIGERVELFGAETVDEQPANDRHVPGSGRLDLAAAMASDHDVEAPAVRVTLPLLQQLPLDHPADVVRRPTLLPAEDVRELEQPHPPVRPLGERHQHQVVGVRQA